MTNPEIADAFDAVADILEFQGANQFRVRAYRNAARTIRDLPEPAAQIAADPDRKLTDIEGIGKDLAEKITALATTGKLEMLEELKQQVPESVLAMLRVPGLGPKRAAMLFKELNVASLDDLRAACEAHKVRQLKGFGAKTEESILAGLPFAAEAGKRVLWAEADDFVQEIVAHMRGCPAVEQIEAAGSYRRGRETVGDLDFLAVAADAKAVMDHLAAYPGVAEIEARGETKLAARLRGGLHVDLRVVPAESFGAALQYFTGSKAHNVIVRGRAKDRGLKVNEYGVFRGEEQLAGADERRGLRGTRPAVVPARNARGPPRVPVGRGRQAPQAGRAGRHPRRPAHAQHLDRRPGHGRGDGPGSQGPRPEVHRHDRPLEAA